MIGHEGINGHAHAILHPTYGDISRMYTFILSWLVHRSLLVTPTIGYYFDGVTHEAFAMLNEEHVWKEYEGYQSVMNVKNDIRDIRVGKLWYKRENEPIYRRYKRAYGLINYLENLRNFDYSEARKLFFTDPPKPTILENKKNKKETTSTRSMIWILYEMIFCLRKDLKIGDVKGHIEEVLNMYAQAAINDNPDYEVISASSNPRHPKEVAFFNSYFCAFPKEECFEFCAYAPTGYTNASAQEILEEMIDSMSFSIRLYNIALNNKVVRNFLSGKYLLVYLKDYKKVLVFDGEEYYEKFMNELLRGDLSKYETLHDLHDSVVGSMEPIGVLLATKREGDWDFIKLKKF